MLVATMHGLRPVFAVFVLGSLLLLQQGLGAQGTSRRSLRGSSSQRHVMRANEARPSALEQPQVPAAAGVQVAARQALFDYATVQGLAILADKVTRIDVPDVTKTFHLPLAGDFVVRLYNVKVQSFSAPSTDARLVILDKFFNLWVEQVGCHVTFDWHWEKPGLGLQGTGDGELFLRNGVISYVFAIAKNEATSRPKLDVKVADSFFESTELKIHSFSADWLYQAVLSLFNDRINTAINHGIARALSEDVPNAMNDVLASLPTHIDVQGLPFTTAFDYSIYTFSYVLFKGYGEVETPGGGAQAGAGLVAAGVAEEQQQQQQQQQQQDDVKQEAGQQGVQSVLESKGQRQQGQQGQQQQQQPLGVSDLVSSVLAQVQRRLQQQRQQQQQPAYGAGSASGHGDGQQLQRCPFEASELPVEPDVLATDAHMVTLYAHESLLNCMAWGLYSVGALQYSVVDGTVPKLHLTTDLMAMLIPQLPKTYPHMLLRIDAEALAAPKVTFKPEGVTVEASYRTSIYVDNATLGVPLVAQLDANVAINAVVGWDSTVITSAAVTHTLVQSTMPVPTAQWDTTVAWFIQNYAGLYPLQFLVEQFVKTPVTSLVALVNTQGQSLDGWFALAGDIQLRNPAVTAAL